MTTANKASCHRPLLNSPDTFCTTLSLPFLPLFFGLFFVPSVWDAPTHTAETFLSLMCQFQHFLPGSFSVVVVVTNYHKCNGLSNINILQKCYSYRVQKAKNGSHRAEIQMLAVLLLKTLRKNLFPRFFFLDPQNLSHSSTLLLAKGSNDESSPLIT